LQPLEPISKGSLLTPLTVSNASDLGGSSPSAVNGTTQAPVRNFFNSLAAAIGGITALTAAYLVKSGTNYLDGNANINEDILDLDTEMDSQDARITTVESVSAAKFTFLTKTGVSGTGSSTASHTLHTDFDAYDTVQLKVTSEIVVAGAPQQTLTVAITVDGDAYGTVSAVKGSESIDSDTSIFLVDISGMSAGSRDIDYVVTLSGGTGAWSIVPLGVF